MKISKAELYEATKRVIKAYYPRNRDDLIMITYQSGCIKLMASGPKMGVQCRIDVIESDEKSFNCLVKGDKLIAYLGILAEEEVDLSFEKYCLYLKTETQRLMLRCIRDAAVMKMIRDRMQDEMAELAPLQAKHIREQILATAHAQGDYTQNYRAACISLEYNSTGSRVSAANRFGVAIRGDLASEESLEKHVFFGPLITIACRIVKEDAEIRLQKAAAGPAKLRVNDNQTSIVLEAEDFSFYNLSTILQQECRLSSKVNRKKLLYNVDIAAFTEVSDRPTVMDMHPQEIRMWTVSPTGEYIGSTEASTEGTGAPWSRVYITSKFLQAALTSLTQEEVRIQYNGKSKPLFVYGGQGQDLEIVMSRNPDFA